MSVSDTALSADIRNLEVQDNNKALYWIALDKIYNKALYWIALDKIYKEPTAVDAWIINFPFLANAPWHIIFKTTHTISPEPYLHSFQYKIVNRILNCGTNLYKWKVKDSPNCSYCDEIDTLEHHLFYCSYTRYFWLQISHWLNDIFGLPGEELTVCEVCTLGAKLIFIYFG